MIDFSIFPQFAKEYRQFIEDVPKIFDVYLKVIFRIVPKITEDNQGTNMFRL